MLPSFDAFEMSLTPPTDRCCKQLFQFYVLNLVTKAAVALETQKQQIDLYGDVEILWQKGYGKGMVLSLQ